MILKELSEAFGVSGNEEEVRQVILCHIKEHAVDRTRPIGQQHAQHESALSGAADALLAQEE